MRRYDTATPAYSATSPTYFWDGIVQPISLGVTSKFELNFNLNIYSTLKKCASNDAHLSLSTARIYSKRAWKFWISYNFSPKYTKETRQLAYILISSFVILDIKFIYTA